MAVLEFDVAAIKRKTLLKNLKQTPIHYLNGQLFLVIQIFPRFLHSALLNIYCSFNITNIIPHSPDDGLVEPKR